MAVEESLGWGEGGVVQPGQDPIPQLLLLPIRQNLFLKLTLKTIPKRIFRAKFLDEINPVVLVENVGVKSYR